MADHLPLEFAQLVAIEAIAQAARAHQPPPLPPPLHLLPSIYRPDCAANDRVRLWFGPNPPPSSFLTRDPLFAYLRELGANNSLAVQTNYGSALRKYHLFCDLFSVEEHRRLPSSFAILQSSSLRTIGTIGTDTVLKYLSAVSTWHVVQGFPRPLLPQQLEEVKFTLKGLARIMPTRKRPPRPPMTINNLRAIKLQLDLTSQFDSAVWAILLCGFFGMMRLGELTTKKKDSFVEEEGLRRRDYEIGRDREGTGYGILRLRRAKTLAVGGGTQDVFITQQEDLCPMQAVNHLQQLVGGVDVDVPLFSWSKDGVVRPVTRSSFLKRVNGILIAAGINITFGHSLRIGGATFYLSEGRPVELVRIAGRWKSLAFELYIRAFELSVEPLETSSEVPSARLG
ncbi:hypothetical protein BDY24DRAFT_355220 [Mrakia frigida]|uniref:uncharacterized protein n=1 Tax=Mrakia frigida TaxID=29902 RepID=UPI003FCBF382